MTERKALLLWLKDNLEHLAQRQQQLEWTRDADTVQLLTESMIRDLECCRSLCDELRHSLPAAA